MAAGDGGWADLSITAAKDQPLTLNLDAGAKLTPNWAAYGNVWAKPTTQTFGCLAGLRYRKELDLYVIGSGGPKGDYSMVGGVRWRF